MTKELTATEVKEMETAVSTGVMSAIKGVFSSDAMASFFEKQVEVQQEAAVVTAKIELGRLAVDNAYKAALTFLPSSVIAKVQGNKFYEGALKFMLGNALGAAFLFEAGRHDTSTRRYKIYRFCADACIYQSQMAMLGGFQLDVLLNGILVGAEKYFDKIPGLTSKVDDDVVLPK